MASNDKTNAGSKKRPSNEEEQEKDSGRAGKTARVVEQVINNLRDDSSKEEEEPSVTTWIEPMQPRPNFDFPADNTKQNFIIYLAIQEPKGSAFSVGLEKCASMASSNLHAHCFQRDGTRHVTMFDGYLTKQQARCLQFRGGNFSPVKVEFQTGWMSWKGGCYLELKETTTKTLKSLLRNNILQGLDDAAAGGKWPCNHLSLYRNRGYGREAFREFQKIRDALSSHDWGSVQGVSIRIKALGTEYDECKVLAGFS